MKTCEACKSYGWLHAVRSETGQREIQRCDDCRVLDDDHMASTLHTQTCRCGWEASLCISCKPTPEGHTSFAAASRSKNLSGYLANLFEQYVLRWAPSYLQTAICDAVYHELRRAADAVAGCPGCAAKVEQIIKDANQERYKG